MVGGAFEKYDKCVPLWGAKVEFNTYFLILKHISKILEINFLILKNTAFCNEKDFLILENQFLILENIFNIRK